MSVINWDACLDPILRNEAWALTGAACGPDSVFQEMVGSHGDNPHPAKAAGPCWVKSHGEGNRHLSIQWSGRVTAMQFPGVKTCCPFLPRSLPFPPSAYFSAYLRWFIATTCNDQSRVAGAGFLRKAGVKLRPTFLNVRCRKERPCSAWLSCYKCSARICPWTWVWYINVMSVNSTRSPVGWWLLLS